jgi:hypothetical protein
VAGIENEESPGEPLLTLEPYTLPSAGGNVGVVDTDVNIVGARRDDALALCAAAVDVLHKAIGGVMSLFLQRQRMVASGKSPRGNKGGGSIYRVEVEAVKEVVAYIRSGEVAVGLDTDRNAVLGRVTQANGGAVVTPAVGVAQQLSGPVEAARPRKHI